MANLRIFNPNIYRPAGGSASPQPHSFSSGWLTASLKLTGWLAATASPQPHFFPSAALRLPLKFTDPAGFQPVFGLLGYLSIRIKNKNNTYISWHNVI
jgi:hypothetical protein